MNYHYKNNFLIGYGEVDEQNRMRISALLNYMQDIATMHSKIIGYGTTKCNELNIAWLLLSWHLQIYTYPRGDTNIEIQTWSRGIKGCHAFRGFEVNDENGNLVARVDSMWTLVDTKLERPIRPYEDMKEGYGTIDRFYFENEKVKIDEPKEFDNKINFKVQRRDIDTNHHCNNTKYIEFALEAIPEDVYKERNISEVEIVYKKAAMYNENIEVTCSKISEDKYINIIKKENGEVAALVKLQFEK